MSELEDPEDAGLDSSYLLFETPGGEAELVSAKQLKSILETEAVPMIDLVILQACHSEIVGKVFQRCCARHVICINKDRAVLDQASIKFTRNLYQNLLSGMQVCAAFNSAVDQTKVVLGRELEHESEKNKLFMLLKHDQHEAHR